MELLVTAEQLTAALQSTPDPVVADLALTRASGLVRAIGGQDFTFVSQETVILAGGLKVLKLPQVPVVVDAENPLTVVEIGDFGGVDFTTVEGRDFMRIGAELTRGYPWLATTRLMGWPSRLRGVWAPRVQVTYSHGDSEAPDHVSTIALDVAVALVTNPAGLRSWTTPEYSETYASELLGAATVESIKTRLKTVGARRIGAFSVAPS